MYAGIQYVVGTKTLHTLLQWWTSAIVGTKNQVAMISP